jgi:TIR domain
VSSPGRITKPVVFVSHAATDEPIVTILRNEMRRIFADGVQVFASSVPGVVRPGTDWLESIRDNLETASAVVVLITPVSINRPWIWFEVGASWSRMAAGSGAIYPICVPEIDLATLPEPLSRLQALSLGKADHIRLFFSTLCDQFGFGSMKGFKATTIRSRLPKYPDLPVAESDLQSGTIYSGPYEGYSTDELKEVLEDELLLPELRRFRSYGTRWRDTLFNGRLIHYREVDERFALPPGTAKRYLIETSKRWRLNVEEEWENSVRFALTESEDEDVEVE